MREAAWINGVWCQMKINKTFSDVVVLVLLLQGVVACNGSGGGSGTADNTGQEVPAGKVSIDGHIFNPDFFVAGADNNITVSYFNPDGTLDSRHDIYDWDGDVLTFAQEWSYNYGQNGRLASVDFEDTYTREASGGLYTHVFSTIVYEYDTAGNVITETEWLTATDDFGNYTYFNIGDSKRSVTTHSYNGSNQRTQTVVDWLGDGNANSSTDCTIAYTYDGAEKLSREDFSCNGGILTYYKEYTYDAVGRVYTKTRTGYSSYPETTTYTYGPSGELQKEEEVVDMSDHSEKITQEYIHEVSDTNNDGNPESSTTYSDWLGPVYDYGSGYVDESPADWFLNAQNSLNNDDDTDGWGLNWEGHSTGTCSTCGNMIGEVNSILMGF
jgi:hypothetical protein